MIYKKGWIRLTLKNLQRFDQASLSNNPASMKILSLAQMRQLYRLGGGSSGSYLVERGWFPSAIQRRAVDRDGRPIPWLSYPFLDFAVPRLRKDMTLVEFGAGQSTRFWAEHVGKVFSVEHNKLWYDELTGSLPANVTLHHVAFDRSKPAEYAASADAMLGVADLVLVDGPERDATLRHAPALLNAHGVIILDNARRASYAAPRASLMELGFKVIDFAGMGPSAARECVTAVFYRDDNCLGI